MLLATDNTGFPCIEFQPNLFVSLLPLTKVQVEQFIYTGEGARALGSDVATLWRSLQQFTSTRYNFEDHKVPAPCGGTASLTTVMRRRPVGDLTAAEEALLATGIRHAAEEGWIPEPCTTPAANTPLAHVLSWMGARQPPVGVIAAGSLPSIAEYEVIRDTFAAPAGEYIHKALESLGGMSPAARRVMTILSRSSRICSEQGLPFLHSGLWELASNCVPMDITDANNRLTRAYYAQAVGYCRFLPCFCQDEKIPRTLLIEEHPCIGARPVFYRNHIN